MNRAAFSGERLLRTVMFLNPLVDAVPNFKALHDYRIRQFSLSDSGLLGPVASSASAKQPPAKSKKTPGMRKTS